MSKRILAVALALVMCLGTVSLFSSCTDKGGGKPDSAMAGIADIGKIDEALSALNGIVEAMLK